MFKRNIKKSSLFSSSIVVRSTFGSLDDSTAKPPSESLVPTFAPEIQEARLSLSPTVANGHRNADLRTVV